MTERELYQQIAESFRQQIFRGELKPGDKLPPMRELTTRWNCTTGTVQRAYQQLASEGLVVSRHGQGTRVVSKGPATQSPTLRSVAIVHKAESFLMESFMSGYNQEEVEGAVRLAFDRWRQASSALQEKVLEEHAIHFSGSHDLALVWVAVNFDELHPDYPLKLTFSGSLGGLLALAEGRAELAGCHLWDSENNSYNDSFIQRVLPLGATTVTLAQRRVGWITAPGNPRQFTGLSDLMRSDITLVNRQAGSGTRVWLDAQLQSQGIDNSVIHGYADEVWTHSEAAQRIAESKADVAFGLEAAAHAFNLNFEFVTLEQYDLVFRPETQPSTGLQILLNYLQSPAAKNTINKLVGYDTSLTGNLRKVN